MTKQKLAGIISILFDPLVEAPFLFVLLFLTKSTAPLWLLPIIIFVDAILPVLFMIYGLRVGFITDWETTDREERYSFNLFWLLGGLLTLFLVYLFGDKFLVRLFLVFVLLFGSYTLITFFWKISGHMTANTALFLVINLFFGWRFWWLILLLPLVAWARWARNKHDIWQLLGGVILSSLVILCGVFLLF